MNLPTTKKEIKNANSTNQEKWFDILLSGEKKEEYREIKPYYMSRFKTYLKCILIHIYLMVSMQEKYYFAMDMDGTVRNLYILLFSALEMLFLNF